MAIVSQDTVFSCPTCGGGVLRTSNPEFVASPLRCPRRDCRHLVRLVDYEVAGKAYRCKRCALVLFTSPTPVGRVWISCPNPTCRHNLVPQTIYLGDGPARKIIGRVRMVIGRRT